ncbi:MAG TPA: hypothetical protein VMU31_00925, partial [Rhizomicrobium sp.]|nr:hypothetical protein [Rhizomicrobium sp.]
MRFAVLISGIFLATPVWAMPLPDCANQVVIANAQVTQVENDGTLILRDGRAAILEGVRLPGADHVAIPEALQALR